MSNLNRKPLKGFDKNFKSLVIPEKIKYFKYDVTPCN